MEGGDAEYVLVSLKVLIKSAPARAVNTRWFLTAQLMKGWRKMMYCWLLVCRYCNSLFVFLFFFGTDVHQTSKSKEKAAGDTKVLLSVNRVVRCGILRGLWLKVSIQTVDKKNNKKFISRLFYRATNFGRFETENMSRLWASAKTNSEIRRVRQRKFN